MRPRSTTKIAPPSKTTKGKIQASQLKPERGGSPKTCGPYCVKKSFLIDDATQPCTTKVDDRTNLLVIPETKELEGQAREKAIEAIRDTAIQSGVLTDAGKNARAVIEKVLLLAGYQKVIFVEN